MCAEPCTYRRVPLLGDYNTQTTMDAEIRAAAGHGVDFFQVLWYDNYPAPRAPGAANLDRGVTNFMASPNAHMMKVCGIPVGDDTGCAGGAGRARVEPWAQQQQCVLMHAGA